MRRILLVIYLFVISGFLKAQNSLLISNIKPQPGDAVHFTYTPPSGFFNATDTIRCLVYKWGLYCDEGALTTSRTAKPVDVLLKKNGTVYEGTVLTDILTRMIAFTFMSGEIRWKMVKLDYIQISGKIDHNQKEGYCIPLYNKEGNECQYSNYFIAKYLTAFNITKFNFGNPDKVLEYSLKELKLYPEAKYYALGLLTENADENNKQRIRGILFGETEKLFSGGLKTTKDIRLLANISWDLGLRSQCYYFNLQQVEMSKSGKEPWDKLYNLIVEEEKEKDLSKKEELLKEYIRQLNSLELPYNQKWNLSSPISMYTSFLIGLADSTTLKDFLKYAAKFENEIKYDGLNIDWTGYSSYMLNTLMAYPESVDYAQKMAQDLYTDYSSMIEHPAAGGGFPLLTGHEYFSNEDAQNEVATAAAVFADYSSQIALKKDQGKQAWEYARASQKYLNMTTMLYNQSTSMNSRYCALAEKNLSSSGLKPQLEKMVASGSWNEAMIAILKRIWMKEHASDAGFDAYVLSLRAESIQEAKKTLIASILNYPAPAFTLKDLDGKQVSLEELKGKTIILDFWATWCGPCKASFPGMQKLVTHYKDNPNIKFLFVDSWEGGHGVVSADDLEKIKKKVSDYILSNNYSFHVLLDSENKVVTDFKIASIPTKFIIDKNGNVRYKVTGYESNEGKLFDEVAGMLDSIK